MKIPKILTASLVGTSVMTAFSYYLSGKTKREFKEPVLLNASMTSSRFNGLMKKNSPPGWILHYSVGFTFTVCYHYYWKSSRTDPSFQNSTLLGLLNGIIGISGWHLLFKIHPNPPSLNLKDYYFHLMAAHIIFGWGTAAGYKFVQTLKEE